MFTDPQVNKLLYKLELAQKKTINFTPLPLELVSVPRTISVKYTVQKLYQKSVAQVRKKIVPIAAGSSIFLLIGAVPVSYLNYKDVAPAVKSVFTNEKSKQPEKAKDISNPVTQSRVIPTQTPTIPPNSTSSSQPSSGSSSQSNSSSQGGVPSISSVPTPQISVEPTPTEALLPTPTEEPTPTPEPTTEPTPEPTIPPAEPTPTPELLPTLPPLPELL